MKKDSYRYVCLIADLFVLDSLRCIFLSSFLLTKVIICNGMIEEEKKAIFYIKVQYKEIFLRGSNSSLSYDDSH